MGEDRKPAIARGARSNVLLHVFALYTPCIPRLCLFTTDVKSQKQAAETEDRRHVLRQQVSEDGIHESYGMPQMPQQSFQLDPQPAMVFRGKFRSLVTNGTGSKTSQDSINKASAGLHNGAPKHSPTGRYGSPSKHAACKSFSPNKEGAANDTSNVEKWLGVSKWCRYVCT